MDLEFTKVQESDFESTFEVFKNHMKSVIESAFGWDEQFQESGFKSRLRLEWFHWITQKKSRVGLVCYKTSQESVHIHLLVIFAEAQRQGLGSAVSKHIAGIAHSHNLPLTLRCFKNNEPALSLYRKLGFSVASEDEHFYDFISKVTSATRKKAISSAVKSESLTNW
jgi:ribosomal protein S18 acetylase RimI-like enzyme